MQGIQQALNSSEPEHLLYNSSAATMPAVNSNGTYSTAHAGGAQQRSRPNAVSNGCSHAALANGDCLKEQCPLPSSARVMQLTSITYLERCGETDLFCHCAIFTLT